MNFWNSEKLLKTWPIVDALTTTYGWSVRVFKLKTLLRWRVLFFCFLVTMFSDPTALWPIASSNTKSPPLPPQEHHLRKTKPLKSYFTQNPTTQKPVHRDRRLHRSEFFLAWLGGLRLKEGQIRCLIRFSLRIFLLVRRLNNFGTYVNNMVRLLICLSHIGFQRR